MIFYGTYRGASDITDTVVVEVEPASVLIEEKEQELISAADARVSLVEEAIREVVFASADAISPVAEAAAISTAQQTANVTAADAALSLSDTTEFVRRVQLLDSVTPVTEAAAITTGVNTTSVSAEDASISVQDTTDFTVEVLVDALDQITPTDEPASISTQQAGANISAADSSVSLSDATYFNVTAGAYDQDFFSTTLSVQADACDGGVCETVTDNDMESDSIPSDQFSGGESLTVRFELGNVTDNSNGYVEIQFLDSGGSTVKTKQKAFDALDSNDLLFMSVTVPTESFSTIRILRQASANSQTTDGSLQCSSSTDCTNEAAYIYSPVEVYE